MIKIVITGSVASGKSTILKIFHDLGAYTLDADTILHKAYDLDASIQKDLCTLCGEQIVTDDRIDRTLLADYIQRNPQSLRQIEGIVHPYVEKVIHAQYKQLSLMPFAKIPINKDPVFVVEIPVFFESPYINRQWFDVVILVTAPEELALARFLKKGKTKKQFLFFKELQAKREIGLQQVSTTPVIDTTSSSHTLIPSSIKNVSSEPFAKGSIDFIIENIGDIQVLRDKTIQILNNIVSNHK